MKSNEEILRTFYQVERIALRDGELHWNISEGLDGSQALEGNQAPEER